MVMQLLIWSSNVNWFIIKPKGFDPTCHLAAFEGQQLKECSAQYLKQIRSLTHRHTLTHTNTLGRQFEHNTHTSTWTHRHKHTSITLNVCCQSPACLSCFLSLALNMILISADLNMMKVHPTYCPIMHEVRTWYMIWCNEGPQTNERPYIQAHTKTILPPWPKASHLKALYIYAFLISKIAFFPHLPVTLFHSPFLPLSDLYNESQ